MRKSFLIFIVIFLVVFSLPYAFADADGSGGTGDASDAQADSSGPGGGFCGDTVCDQSEDCVSCSQDCGHCATGYCGDTFCNNGETCSSCYADCSSTCPPPTCNNNGVCEGGNGENCQTCSGDCGFCGQPCNCNQCGCGGVLQSSGCTGPSPQIPNGYGSVCNCCGGGSPCAGTIGCNGCPGPTPSPCPSASCGALGGTWCTGNPNTPCPADHPIDISPASDCNRCCNGYGTLFISATSDGQQYSGSYTVNYQFNTVSQNPVTISGSKSSPAPAGTYKIVSASGPPSSSLSSVTPSNEQSLSVGGTIGFTLNFVTIPATITVNVLLDGAAYNGPFSITFIYNGGSSQSASFNSAPAQVSVPPGSYQITSGTLSGAVLESITPSQTQGVLSGASISFTLSFTTKGTIDVNVKKDTAAYTGPLDLNYTYNGVSGSYSFAFMPVHLQDMPQGTYTISGASTPQGSKFQGISPSATQSLSPAGNIAYTINFCVSHFGNKCNCNACGCGGTYNCGGTCSGPAPGPANVGSACGNCGKVSCTGTCINQGPCSSGQTQCVNGRFQSCSGTCQWANTGTNADGDAMDAQCGDSLCDNVAGIYDSTRTSTETNCADGIDNDCNGKIDCADPACAGSTGLGGATCCQTPSNCIQNNCVIESCTNNNCQYANRNKCDPAECPPGQFCNAPGGTCTTPPAEICNDGIDNNCDGLIDCADPACAGQSGPGGATCCQTPSNCIQNNCVIESCTSNTCQYTNRNFCDSTECPSGQHCNSQGICASPDQEQDVCINCVTDQTPGLAWTWSPPKHEDAGKSYSTNADVFTSLFNSNGGPCTAASGGPCFNTNNVAVNHKPALGTGNCCGNDPNEYYKPDYYGGECTSDINDCVWSTGDAQSSDTGNIRWWCFQHEWSHCNDTTIGSHAGGVVCAGIVGNNGWTPNPLPENLYSCTDGLDNDGNGLVDCADPACSGTISGYVKDTSDKPIELASVVAKKDTTTVRSTTSNSFGAYSLLSFNCGTFNLIASSANYAPKAASVNITPNQNIVKNFTLVPGTSCQQDCTYAVDQLIHSPCDGINGCTFYDSTSKAACDYAQPGWLRDYNATHYVVCPSGAPQPKILIQASLSCPSGTLVKVTRIVYYNGKPVKLVVATCG